MKRGSHLAIQVLAVWFLVGVVIDVVRTAAGH